MKAKWAVGVLLGTVLAAPAGTPTPKVARMTTGNLFDPSLSPDSRHIVFRRMLGETKSEVFVADSDGSHAVNLTRNPAFDGWLAWSPDGLHIASAFNRASGPQVCKICVMAADGSDVRLVADTGGRGTASKWRPDGRSILFTICKRAGTDFNCEVYRALSGR